MTNANMDWTQTGAGNPTGYTPAFRSGHLGPSPDADVSYLLRDAAPNNSSNARPPYNNIGGYHSHSNHLGSSLQSPDFWPQQNDSSHNDTSVNEPPPDETAHDEPDEPGRRSWVPAPDGVDPLDPRNYTKAQLVAMPRSQRRKLYVIKPDPSAPRAFRPFQPFEKTNTMLAEWSTPTIIGSYIMFPNKMLKHNPMPPGIDEAREKLFKCDESILLRTSQEVADYLPHVTNYWRRAVWRHEMDEENGVQTEYWTCRQKRVKKPPKRPETAGKGLRNRPKKSLTFFDEYEPCQMRLRVVSFTKHAKTDATHTHWGGTGGNSCKCIPEWVHLEKCCPEGAPEQHTHGQEIMDAWKRSEAVGVLAKLKCEEGNTYAAVANWLRKEYGNVSKQVFKYEKGDVANAAKSWRETYRDLVLHDEVPEDSEEMTTMRRCVDAIWEADADTLRAALREVIKDSDALTKTALKMLQENKPAAPVQQAQDQPRALLEGVSVLDIPHPGPGEKLVEVSKVQGPPRTYLPEWHRDDMVRAENARKEFESQYRNQQCFSTAIGPDGRPIPASGVSRGPGRPRNQPAPNHPAIAPPMQGASLQPRPTIPQTVQHPYPGGIRYVYLPAPQPTPQPQRGCVHPITFSMEVPSCPLDTCKQCKHMRRGTAGRTFFFQDKMQTPGQFQKLQNLLRDPQQLLNDDYTRSLHQSAVESVHPHPALQEPERREAHTSQTPGASGQGSQNAPPTEHMQAPAQGDIQLQPPYNPGTQSQKPNAPPQNGAHVHHGPSPHGNTQTQTHAPPQTHSQSSAAAATSSLREQAEARMADVESLLRSQRNSPRSGQQKTDASAPFQGQSPSSKAHTQVAPANREAGAPSPTSPGGETEGDVPGPQHSTSAAPASIYDQSLPIPVTIEDDGEKDEGSGDKDGDDEGGEQGNEAEEEPEDEMEGQPPAKRQRQLSAEESEEE